MAERTVSVRAQGAGDQGSMTLDAYCDHVKRLVSEEIDEDKLQ